MSREGYKLTEWAERDRQDYRDKHGDGNCSCHLRAPCGACTHLGHPEQQEANDKCWEKEETKQPKYRIVLWPGGWVIIHKIRRLTRKRKNQVLSEVSKIMARPISKVRRDFMFACMEKSDV